MSTQAALDNAVMQVRALLDRVRQGGLAPADFTRATNVASREAVTLALDPRTRLIATWRGEAVPTAAQPLPRGRASTEDVRAFAGKRLGEETMVVVAARPGITRASAPTPPETARVKSP